MWCTVKKKCKPFRWLFSQYLLKKFKLDFPNCIKLQATHGYILCYQLKGHFDIKLAFVMLSYFLSDLAKIYNFVTLSNYQCLVTKKKNQWLIKNDELIIAQ